MSGLIAVHEVFVRDVDKRADLGKRTVRWPEDAGVKAYGFGTDLQTPAFREVEAAIDLEAHRGEHVATVTYDLDARDYRIEWHVRRPLRDRLRGLLP